MSAPTTATADCCAALSPPAPREVSNAAGLPEIEYRIGSIGSFVESMVLGAEREPALAKLTARDQDDYAFTFVTLWAYIGDILTFYQERIANEAYLRTATQRDSVRELAALVDYEPAPGLAATTWVAFTVEKETAVPVAAGAKIASVPGPGEKAQKFETTESIIAYRAWNELRFAGKPAPGALLAGAVQLSIDAGILAANAFAPPAAGQSLLAIAPGGLDEVRLTTVQRVAGTLSVAFSPALSGARDVMLRVRRKIRLYGFNAPENLFVLSGAEWSSSKLDTTFKATKTLHLEARYVDLRVGAKLVIVVEGGTPIVTTVAALSTVTTSLLELSTLGSKAQVLGAPSEVVTQVQVEVDVHGDRRDVVIYEIDGELGPLSMVYPAVIAAGTQQLYVPEVDVAARLAELASLPRKMFIDDSSRRPELVSVRRALAFDAAGSGKPDHVVLQLEGSLTRDLEAASAMLLGNVAAASHGETVASEVLGDGDASVPFAAYRLAKSPLTFVPDPAAPHGAGSTLRVWVSGALWSPMTTLLGQPGDSEIYTARRDSGESTLVQFGDGREGARVTTGRANVVATYRHGLGSAGNVGANRLTGLLTRPAGLRASTNPLPAAGGAEPEALEAARTNAPNAVRTLGRVISLEDFEDEARSYQGIGKAKASWTWDPHAFAQVVRLSVAADGDAAASEQMLADLRATLDARRDPHIGLSIVNVRSVAIRVRVLVVAEANLRPSDVRERVRSALAAEFSSDKLAIGESIYPSAVYAVAQRVRGVVGVTLTRLAFLDPDVAAARGLSTAAVQRRLFIDSDELAGLNPSDADALEVEVGS